MFVQHSDTGPFVKHPSTSDGGELYRSPPHNIEVEQALLGAVMLNNDAYHRLDGRLRPDHFFDPLHADIFDTAAKLIDLGKRADPVTLRPFFADAKPIGNELSVVAYLARLVAAATTVSSAPDYADTIVELAKARQLILIGEDAAEAAYAVRPNEPIAGLIEETERRLYTLAEPSRFGAGAVPFKTAVIEAIERANLAYQKGGGLSGLSTGLRDLDAKLGGLQPTDLLIVAGRPGIGKTALATNIALNVAKVDIPVGFFSLEMSREQLATRILSEQAEVPSEAIRRGTISEDAFRRLRDAAESFSPLPIYIDQAGGLTISQVTARSRRLRREQKIELLVVDYLQLLAGTSRRSSENRVAEITEITMGLKALAKELGLPIIALSQLSRNVENRTDKRPQLSDLRESGSIEQDADVVIFVYREEYYLSREEPDVEDYDAYKAWQIKMQRAHGVAEAIIAKQRHGPTGTVPLAFAAAFTRFSDLADDNRLPMRTWGGGND